jgi:hypothetical protein
MNTDKIRWMGYDLLGYLCIILLMVVIFHFNPSVLGVFFGWAIYQALKWVFCADATRYPEWNLAYRVRKSLKEL